MSLEMRAQCERCQSALEADPLLSKDIRFYFVPNSSTLDLSKQENLAQLDSIKNLLRVSPGSILSLRGHVDDSRVQEFTKQGPEMLRRMTLEAVELSKKRANEIKRLLIERQGVDASRVEAVGIGWREPIGKDPEAEKRMEQNRRVEVQWFTVE